MRPIIFYTEIMQELVQKQIEDFFSGLGIVIE
jgi:hypothetical protein